MLTTHFRRREMLESLFPFEKWTKKMSKNENPKYFSAFFGAASGK